MGHSVALYCQNYEQVLAPARCTLHASLACIPLAHASPQPSTRRGCRPALLAQIQQLEATLAQYGYRDLYAPLPPENPLDMLELHAAGQAQRRQPCLGACRPGRRQVLAGPQRLLGGRLA